MLVYYKQLIQNWSSKPIIEAEYTDFWIGKVA